MSTNSKKPEPCVLVIFGASGDLTQRKLVPALYSLERRRNLPEGLRVVGVSRTKMSDDDFRSNLREGVKHAEGEVDKEVWSRLAPRIHYHPADATKPDAFEGLSKRIHDLADEAGAIKPSGSPNVLFYLSVAPQLYEPIIERIGGSGLITEGKRWCSLNPEASSWQRIIVEKPFGSDLSSAKSLNRALGRVFEEEDIYRIDHFLGKELVQNILVMRFANSIFEPLWNRRHVDHVQVTAAENIGVGTRASYYDGPGGGALRDMVQSHLLQVLALVAIEPPSSYDGAAIMREKIKLFLGAEQIDPADAPSWAALGRYGAGRDAKAYTDEKGVDPARKTETYAAMCVRFDNWRWAGVPFFLRSGKRMAAKVTEIVVQFKPVATNLFRTIAPHAADRPANRLIISMAPWEGISLSVEGKVPGAGLTIDTAELDLDYLERFGGEKTEAYGPLILDAMRGDRTLFKHRDEVESSWAICQPLLDSRALRESIETYPAGSWGPHGADRLLARSGRLWHNPESA